MAAKTLFQMHADGILSGPFVSSARFRQNRDSGPQPWGTPFSVLVDEDPETLGISQDGAHPIEVLARRDDIATIELQRDEIEYQGLIYTVLEDLNRGESVFWRLYCAR